MSTEIFEKDRVEDTEASQEATTWHILLRTNTRFKVMLVGLCIGLSYFVSDVIRRIM